MTRTNTNSVLVILLVASLCAAGYLAYKNISLRVEKDLLREIGAGCNAERDALMALLPEVAVNISKTQLASIIRNTYPDEDVNVLEDHVQWRLFQFWIGKNGKLETVSRGS